MVYRRSWTDRALAGLSPQLLASSIKLYASEVVCTGCKKQFMDSVSEVAARWASVKVSSCRWAFTLSLLKGCLIGDYLVLGRQCTRYIQLVT